MERKPCPSDVTDDEWAFVAPYLTLITESAPQREHSLREVFNGLRWLVRTSAPWRMMPHDLPPWHAVYQQTQRWMAACCFEAIVHDLRRLLRELAAAVQEATGESVELAYVDQGYTGEAAAEDAAQQGIQLGVVKLPEAKKGFVLLPRRWVVERSFAWLARFRRLARDYERLPKMLAALHFVVFSMLMLVRAAPYLATLASQ